MHACEYRIGPTCPWLYSIGPMHATAYSISPTPNVCHGIQHEPTPIYATECNRPNVLQLTIALSQVPSATPKLVEMFLDMVSENERQQRLPHRDMFDDGHGKFQFYDGICAYLQGMTTRSCANIFTPHGGGAGSNNATEAQNKVSHQQMPIRRHPVTHISEMLAHMHTISRRDVSFNDWFRRDMWSMCPMYARKDKMHARPYSMGECVSVRTELTQCM